MVDVPGLLVAIVIGYGFWALISLGLSLLIGRRGTARDPTEKSRRLTSSLANIRPSPDLPRKSHRRQLPAQHVV
jgi:hypothetical protein